MTMRIVPKDIAAVTADIIRVSTQTERVRIQSALYRRAIELYEDKSDDHNPWAGEMIAEREAPSYQMLVVGGR